MVSPAQPISTTDDAGACGAAEVVVEGRVERLIEGVGAPAEVAPVVEDAADVVVAV